MGLSQSFPGLTACQILVPQPQIKPGPPAVKAPSPNHWTPGGPMVQVSLHSSVPASCSSLSGVGTFCRPHQAIMLTQPRFISCCTFSAGLFNPGSFIFILFFWSHCEVCRLSSPAEGGTCTPALEAQSRNHWTTGRCLVDSALAVMDNAAVNLHGQGFAWTGVFS